MYVRSQRAKVWVKLRAANQTHPLSRRVLIFPFDLVLLPTIERERVAPVHRERQKQITKWWHVMWCLHVSQSRLMKSVQRKKDMNIFTVSEWKGVDISKCWLNVRIKTIEHDELWMETRFLLCTMQQLFCIMSNSKYYEYFHLTASPWEPSFSSAVQSSSWYTSLSVWLTHLKCENCVGHQWPGA